MLINRVSTLREKMHWQIWFKKFLWDKPASLIETYNLWAHLWDYGRYKMTGAEFQALRNAVIKNIVLCVVCFGYGMFVLWALVMGFIYIPFEEMPWRHVFIDCVQVFFAYRVMVYGINKTAEMLGRK